MAYEIYRLHLAEVSLQGKFNPPTYRDSRIAVYAYLLTNATGAVLVDTGVGEANSHVDRTFAPERTPIGDELKRCGVALEDVKVVINSHLHFDHCGNNRLFPDARFYIQSAELEVARTTPYTVREWFDFDGANIVSVGGDDEIASGLRLLATPGHTPGHQSVLVDGVCGKQLIAAQAAFTADEFARGGDPTEQAHEGLADTYVRSIKRLQSLNAEKVLFSHDDHGQTGVGLMS